MTAERERLRELLETIDKKMEDSGGEPDNAIELKDWTVQMGVRVEGGEDGDKCVDNGLAGVF